MNRSKERIIESFIIGMFPIALVVGCTTNGNEQSESKSISIHEQLYTESSQALGLDDLDQLTILDTRTTSNLETANSPVDSTFRITPEIDNSDMAVMQFAVYKPEQIEQQSRLNTKLVKYSEIPNELKLNKFVFHFDSSDYNLTRSDLEELQYHAEFLQQESAFTLTISGHSDQIGPQAKNQLLSEQRAHFVADILITYGVNPAQLVTQGFGESLPLNSADKLEENRRVELQYSKALLLSSM